MQERIVEVQTFGVCLPYHRTVAFRSVTQDGAEYALLRLVTESGLEGIAESVARPEQSGFDARSIAYAIETYYRPMLIGADPLSHEQVLPRLRKITGNHLARAMVDTALWDLRARALGQPAWRLFGGGCEPTIPLSWVIHRAPVSDMVETATAKAADGYRALKLKIHANAATDVRMVREVRQAVGDGVMLYVDANGNYSEAEARALLQRIAEFDIRFAEDPCITPDVNQQAAFARSIPMPLLGDKLCNSAPAVLRAVGAHAVGAVNTKVQRTGITESMQIIGMCEAAGVPVIFGTDSPSRVGALARLHLRAGLASLAPWPAETFFFQHLADDCFVGEFNYERGAVTLPDAPGFGASLDMAKIKRYAI